jgi:putative ABC transport system permease protein
VPLWVNVLVPVGMFALVLLTALAPALRAGRLSAIQAIATGQAPSQGRGYGAHRFAARLRLPRPVSIGLAAPFARPGRTVVTLAAIAFGAVAVIFAVGLDASLAQASDGQTHASAVQVQAGLNGPGGIRLGSRQDLGIRAALRKVPGTSRYVAEDFLELGVPGLTQPVNTEAFVGNASWTGYQLISGHWYHGTGQADVNTGFLQATGLKVGDSVSVSAGSRPVRVRIVGEVFDPEGKSQGAMLTSWQTLGGSAAGLKIQQYDIQVKPGVSVSGYASQLNHDLGQQYFVGTTARSGQFYQIAEELIAILTLMLAVVAGLGVLNTVLISTRDRVHDLGVFKAVGMTPRQVIAMVVCWVVVPAVIAAAIAIPAAMALHVATVNAMGRAAGTGISSVIMDVYKPAEIVLLGLSALLIAAIGALLPASWAAAARTATALRAE